MADFDEKSNHMLSSEIYHESSETFSKSVRADEGLFKHYFRKLHLVAGFFGAITLSFKLYVFMFDAALHCEDY